MKRYTGKGQGKISELSIDPQQLEQMQKYTNVLAGKFEITMDQIVYEALDTWLESAGPARLEVQNRRQGVEMASAGSC